MFSAHYFILILLYVSVARSFSQNTSQIKKVIVTGAGSYYYDIDSEMF